MSPAQNKQQTSCLRLHDYVMFCNCLRAVANRGCGSAEALHSFAELIHCLENRKRVRERERQKRKVFVELKEEESSAYDMRQERQI